MKRWTTAAVGALLGVLVLASGCEEATECGAGTRLEAGMCVLDREPERAICGVGTVYDEATEQCLPLFPPTTCGEQPSCIKTDEGYYQCSCGDAVDESCP